MHNASLVCASYGVLFCLFGLHVSKLAQLTTGSAVLADHHHMSKIFSCALFSPATCIVA